MKIVYYIIKGISMILSSPVVIIAIPGAILHFLAEEIEERIYK
jgi:hypothetical protein